MFKNSVSRKFSLIIRPPNASEKVDQLLREWADARFQTARQRPRLYHYSGTQALNGVIASNEFWATDVREMNDDQEIHYGQGLVKELIDGTSVTQGTLFARVVECVDQMIPKFLDLLSVYLVCFSTNRNSALLWENYGSYSVLLDTFSVRDPDQPKLWFTLGPVEYDRATQLGQLAHAVNQVRDALFGQPADLRLDGEGGVKWLASHLVSDLAQQITFMKSTKWAGEEEWRLTYSQPVNGPRQVHERGIRGGEVKHFVKLPIRGDDSKHDGRTPILAITRDDTAELDAAAIATLLTSHNYPVDQIDILERAHPT